MKSIVIGAAVGIFILVVAYSITRVAPVGAPSSASTGTLKQSVPLPLNPPPRLR